MAPAYAQPTSTTTTTTTSEYVTPKSDNQWVINFNDTDIRTVIQQVAKITGESYIINGNVNGKVNMMSQTPLKKQEISELLRSVLYVNGFSVVPSGGNFLIKPNDEARKNKVPVDVHGNMTGEAFVARVIPVRFANVNELLQAMQPLVSDFAVLRSLPDSNALLIADKADNVQKVAQLVSELDYPETDDVETVRLSKSSVSSVMPLLEKLAPRELGASGNRSVSPLRLVGDERNNVILLKGNRESRARLHALITQLDQSNEEGDAIQVITLHNADAAKTADILKDMFGVAGPNNPQVFIKANPMTNALVIHAPPATVDQIRKTLAQLDIPRPQVLIEAAIVEISDDLLEELGIQFGAGEAGFSSGLAATVLPLPSGSVGTLDNVNLATFLSQHNRPNSDLLAGGLNAAFGSNKLSILVKALSNDSRANLLSTPSISTVANEEAKIVVGQNVPFRTGSYDQASATPGVINPFTTIQRQDVGITLKVTPQINVGERVTLKVEQEVSSLQDAVVAGAADIITNKRTINTTIMANNGQTMVLGGLISDNRTKTKGKVPVLGDIPGLGLLFQSNSERNVKNNLLVFLRPTIIASDADVQGVNMRKYNGIWELRLGENAKDNPLTIDRLNTETEKNFNGTFSNSQRESDLPWVRSRAAEKPLPSTPTPAILQGITPSNGAPAPLMPEPSAAVPPVYNYNYTYTGADQIAPTKLFDDGSATFFKFNPAMQAPSVAVVENGMDVPLKAVQSGEFWMVNRIAKRFTLRSGDMHICVYNENLR